jgi:hypothetical protein
VTTLYICNSGLVTNCCLRLTSRRGRIPNVSPRHSQHDMRSHSEAEHFTALRCTSDHVAMLLVAADWRRYGATDDATGARVND